MKVNHYKWLNKHFFTFLERVSGVRRDLYGGIVVAHGDKCYSYMRLFEEHSVPFPHGVALYLLTHIHPYSTEVREQTGGGWVSFEEWFVANKDRFLYLLPPVDASDPEVQSPF